MVAASESQSGGASWRGSAFRARLDDGGVDGEGTTEGKFGRGVACIGESDWWRRREPAGGASSRPAGVAGNTLPRRPRDTAQGSSSEVIGSGGEWSADSMDLYASSTSASPDALSSAPEVPGATGSLTASGASGKAAAWRRVSTGVADEGVATDTFGGGRASGALEFFPPVRSGSGSTQVFSACSPNKKAGVRPQGHAEGGTAAAAAAGDMSDFEAVSRDVGQRDGASGACNSDENAAPPAVGDAPADPSSISEMEPRSRGAAPSAAGLLATSPAGATLKHPRSASRPGVTSVEAANLHLQSVLVPPGGVGDAREDGGKPAGLDFLRGLPSSARAAGSGWQGRVGAREWRQQQRQQHQHQHQQPQPQQHQHQQQQQAQSQQPQPQQPQQQQRRRKSLRLGSRRQISYVEVAPLRRQHPTLMTFWNGAQGGSSSEASGKAQGGSDRMASSS